MSDAKRVTAAGRSVCLSPGYAMAVGPFDPFAAARCGQPWNAVETWSHTVQGPCEALMSLRFAAFSRLSEGLVKEEEAVSESSLRARHAAPGGGLLHAEVVQIRKEARANKTFVVGPGGIDVFGSGLRVSLMAPPSMRPGGLAEFPLQGDGFGVLEEVWSPLLGEDGTALRPKSSMHTYCAEGIPAPVPASAVRYEVHDAEVLGVVLSAGSRAVKAMPSGPVCGFRSITLDRDAVVAWEIEP